MRRELHSITIELTRADITRQDDIDAVVNAANAELAPGGGVAGAIHRAAGPKLHESCRSLAPIEPGEAVITDAFDLPNRKVIHCLGPVYGSDEPSYKLLASCYRNALRLAEEHDLSSIAFPAISTGAFGYPMRDAANVAMRTIADEAPKIESVSLIRFCLFGDDAFEAHAAALKQIEA